MSENDAFTSYNWEEDSGWQTYWKSIDQDTLNNKPKAAREHWINKKKAKWYKKHVDETYDPPAPPKPTSQQRQTQQETKPSRPKQCEQHFVEMAAFSRRWYFYLLCNCWCVIGAPLMIPWLKNVYRSIIVANAAVYGYYLFHTYGRPKFQRYYAKLLFLDENLFHFSYPLMCMMLNPGMIWLAPILLRIVPLANAQLEMLILEKVPGMYDHLQILLNYIDQRRMRWTSLSYSVEVWTAILMIPGSLLAGMGILVSAVIYWQFLRMKYMMCENCRIAFRDANARIRNYIPGMLLSYYDFFTIFLHQMGDLAYLKGKGSIGRGCSVM